VIVEALAPPLPELVPGAYVTMEISLARPRQALNVPLGALQTDAEGKPYVWLLWQGGERGPLLYTCVMHPEVVAERPGKCPKCGMELVAKTREGREIAHRQPVEVGDTEGTRVEIRSGLSPEHQVIVAGFQSLVEGMPVRAVPWGPEGPLEVPSPVTPSKPTGHEGHQPPPATPSEPSGHEGHPR
jgi:multidrug efflux pump subunit AcrA (membrane-fusion protein)